MSKKTALYEEHLKLHAKIVDFAGWLMPIQYDGLAREHENCRKNVSLFDVSHMGEVLVEGSGSLEFLNSIVTNDVTKIVNDQAQYTVMCNPQGGCVDDLIIHRMNENKFFLCVNASNTDKDFEWIKSHAPKNITVKNLSSEYSQIAIQGRHAEKVLQKLTSVPLSQLKTYWFKEGQVLGKKAIIARTGYTGEDGFEVYVSWNDGPAVWQTLLNEGSSFGIKACGLGARDTLRTEMKYALYGHEIDDEKNPLESGLGWVTKLDKSDFVGKSSLIKLKEAGLKKTLVGLKTTGRGIPRQAYRVLSEQAEDIGFVTSGTLSPSLQYGIAIALIDKAHSKIGSKLHVQIRDQRVEHEVVQTPFYKRDY